MAEKPLSRPHLAKMIMEKPSFRRMRRSLPKNLKSWSQLQERTHFVQLFWGVSLFDCFQLNNMVVLQYQKGLKTSVLHSFNSICQKMWKVQTVLL